jgi:hypothetical protein
MRHDGRRRFTAIPPLVAAAAIAVTVCGGPAGTLVADDAQARSAVARTARVLSLDENGSLHLTSKHGFTLNEQGLATGTVKGTIDVRLTIASSSRVTAELEIYPSGGSITARGSAAYHEQSANAHFAGSIAIEHGTGSYTHAQGSGLSFSGTIERSNDAITVHVAGRAVD